MTLLADISEYAHRTDISDTLGLSFIAKATARLGHDLKVFSTEKTASIDTSSTFDLPADFRSMRSVSVDRSGQRIELLAFSFREAANHQTVSASGLTIGYTLQNEPSTITPVPSNGAVLDLIYFAEPAEITVAEPTNATNDDYPYLYLYSSLIEFATWAQDFEYRNHMLTLYVAELQLANDKGASAQSGPGVSRGTQRPVSTGRPPRAM